MNNDKALAVCAHQCRVTGSIEQLLSAAGTCSGTEYRTDMYIYIHIAVFTHGPQGPGPRAANFQGRHIKKKSRLKYGMRKKKAVHEREI